MQLGILKNKIILYISFVALLTLNCSRKSDVKGQITIKIKAVDSKTKQLRINSLDTIDIKVIKFGYLMKEFITIGEYIIDSSGSVKVKLDPKEEYHISLYGTDVFGWADFNENELKAGQEVTIEALPSEKR